MIEVHHLNNSRSQRILWMLEELGLEYEIVHYQRDPETNPAPESLRAIDPLDKSSVIEDGDRVAIESGAPLEPRVNSEIENHIGYLDSQLAESEFFVGDEFSSADIQLSFPSRPPVCSTAWTRSQIWPASSSG